MPQIQQFRLPDAGEGLTEAEIVSWRVRPGDTVRVNDPIVEIETAKSLVELPCPFAGVVTELLVPEGATVDVGTPIIAVDTAPAAGGTPADGRPADGTPPEEAVAPGLIGGPAPGGRTSVLVGYGPRTVTAARRPRKRPDAQAAASIPSRGTAEDLVPALPAQAADPAPRRTPRVESPATVEVPGPVDGPAARAHVLAKPPVRKLAKDLGVDITSVRATGPGGVVTREDVERAVRGGPDPAPDLLLGEAGPPLTRPGTVAADGRRETRIPIRGVRKVTAQAMVASAFTAPHVTEWVQVDVTRTMKLVERLRTDREFTGVKVSPLLLVARALLVAVRRNPGVNATWDDAAQEIVLKHYVNLGIAAATPRGLVVPNIKDADRLSLLELGQALAALTATAREGRTPPADMAGGTITITNVGVFGIDAGTPILNPGESAILAFGQVRKLPWVHKGKVKPRWVTQLALSFDHRLVDGDLGSRTLADVAAVLEDPGRALVWG